MAKIEKLTFEEKKNACDLIYPHKFVDGEEMKKENNAAFLYH